MKVSVIIPAYNAAGTIKRAITSCIEQTLKPYEIIVADDASTDDTLHVLSAFPDIKVIKSSVNSGPSVARNNGWNIATGDIVAFLDADDAWHPEKIKIISKLFIKHPNISFIGHPYILNDFSSIPQHIIPQKKGFLSILISNPYQSSCIAIRRSVNERFIDDMRYCEDHELAMRIAYKLGCYSIPVTLTRLGRPQLTEGGASGNLWKMRLGEMSAYTATIRYNPILILTLPLLWILSLSKFALRWLLMVAR